MSREKKVLDHERILCHIFLSAHGGKKGWDAAVEGIRVSVEKMGGRFEGRSDFDSTGWTMGEAKANIVAAAKACAEKALLGGVSEDGVKQKRVRI